MGATGTPDRELDSEVLKAGLKYVSGDLTFNVGVASGTTKDGAFGTPGTTEDSKDVTSACILCSCFRCNSYLRIHYS